MVNFLFVMIELFSLSLTVQTFEVDISQSRRFFLKGVGHFKYKFQMEEGVAHQPLLVSEN